jgi:hypothetical protein
MPDLLHEYWETADGGEFGAVGERSDQLRRTLAPDARLVFRLRASSWDEAMRHHHERLGYGEYSPVDEGADHFYTDEEAAAQEAYLQVRRVR